MERQESYTLAIVDFMRIWVRIKLRTKPPPEHVSAFCAPPAHKDAHKVCRLNTYLGIMLWKHADLNALNALNAHPTHISYTKCVQYVAPMGAEISHPPVQFFGNSLEGGPRIQWVSTPNIDQHKYCTGSSIHGKLH